jgi:hypothetical protein
MSEFLCPSAENDYEVKENTYLTTNDKMRASNCIPNEEVTKGAGRVN